jgi:glucose-6-phosphate 1-epimerase
MALMNSATAEKNLEPGRVLFLDGQSELPMLKVSTRWSTAEIYLHGAHVTNFTLNNQPPLLFMSQCSRFAPEQPIRGGVPIIFPWFGAREDMPQHGFARLKSWELKEFAPAADGSVRIRFCLPDCPEASAFPPFTAEYLVTVDQALTLQLIITNQSPNESFTFENCLHSYFDVGDVTALSITGLKGLDYLDKASNFAQKSQSEDPIRISSEVDRIYLSLHRPVESVGCQSPTNVRFRQ